MSTKAINENKKQDVEYLVKQYQGQITKSILSAFYLDALLVRDKDGGDVDTIHNIRNGIDLKNNDVRETYNNRPEYDRTPYDRNLNFKKFSEKENSKKILNGEVVDAYSKEKRSNISFDRDHIISAHETHNDKAIYLARMNPVELANIDSNLAYVSSSLNRSKGKLSMDKFINKIEGEIETNKDIIARLSKKDSLNKNQKEALHRAESKLNADYEKMNKLNEMARKERDKVLSEKYYTSSYFYKDSLNKAVKTGIQMGLREVLGILIYNIWLRVKSKTPILFKKLRNDYDIKKFLKQHLIIIKESFVQIQSEFKELISKFSNGLVSGILSSVMTTIINIYKTTFKNVVKIIRELWATIVESVKTLAFNPDGLPYGEVIRSTIRIITAGSSVVIGSTIQEYLSKALTIPDIIKGPISIFVGSMVTGVLSISIFYFLDNSKVVNNLVDKLNSLKSEVDASYDYFIKVKEEYYRYSSELMQISTKKFQDEIDSLSSLTRKYYGNMVNEEKIKLLNTQLIKYNITLPYENSIGGLDNFMNDQTEELHFKL